MFLSLQFSTFRFSIFPKPRIAPRQWDLALWSQCLLQRNIWTSSSYMFNFYSINQEVDCSVAGENQRASISKHRTYITKRWQRSYHDSQVAQAFPSEKQVGLGIWMTQIMIIPEPRFSWSFEVKRRAIRPVSDFAHPRGSKQEHSWKAD